MLLALTCFAVLILLLRALRMNPWVSAILAGLVTVGVTPYLAGHEIGTGTRWGIAIGAALLLLPYYLGPVLIRAMQRMPADGRFERYDSTVHQSPEMVRTAIRDAVASLTAAGFTPLGDAFRPVLMGQPAIQVTLLENRATEQKAMAAGIFQNLELVSSIATHVEIGTKLSDGRLLLANNSATPTVFAPVAGKVAEILPSVRDAARLAAIHQRIVERTRGDTTPIRGEAHLDVLRFLDDAMRLEMEQQIPTGYLWLDDVAKAYRPTWKGAALMCWKLLPPLRGIRAARIRRREAALLAELGMTASNEQAGSSVAAKPAVQYRLNWAGIAAVGLIAAYIAAIDSTRAGAIQPTVETPAVPVIFDVPNDFPGAVRALEQLAGARAEPLMVRDSLGTRVKVSGARIPVREALAESLLVNVQDEFLERGYFLFRHEPHYDLNGQPDEVALVPMWDQFRVVKLVGTNGANRSLANADVITWLRELERDAPFVLTGIGYDHVEGRFTRPLADPHAMALRLYKFCPDVVDQGTGSVTELATELRRLNTFFCWWD